MNARVARARLAQKADAAEAAGLPVERVGRFAERVAGRRAPRVPLFELRRWPSWTGLDPDTQGRVWRIAALVAARDALPELIEGALLRAYAARVGEPAFEAILDLDPGGGAALPALDALDAAGREIAERGLPALLAAAKGVAATADPAAAAHLVLAERIAREAR